MVMTQDTEPRRANGKSAAAFRTISEVAVDLDVPPHVLRFWETKFAQIRPLKRGGGRRYYRPEDVDLLRRIRALLYAEGYTIKGVQRLLKDGGPLDKETQERDGEEEPAAASAGAGAAPRRPSPVVAPGAVPGAVPGAAPGAVPGAVAGRAVMTDVLDELLELRTLLASVRR